MLSHHEKQPRCRVFEIIRQYQQINICCPRHLHILTFTCYTILIRTLTATFGSKHTGALPAKLAIVWRRVREQTGHYIALNTIISFNRDRWRGLTAEHANSAAATCQLSLWHFFLTAEYQLIVCTWWHRWTQGQLYWLKRK